MHCAMRYGLHSYPEINTTSAKKSLCQRKAKLKFTVNAFTANIIENESVFTIVKGQFRNSNSSRNQKAFVASKLHAE